jgi:predicted enzyme related to lactoylglutathione lyase
MPAVELSHGHFCWVDLITNDPEAATAFYGALLGWEAFQDETDYGAYTLFRKSDADAAGMVRMGPDMESQGMPAMWNSYIQVEDVEAMAERCTALGGTVLMPPQKVAETGSMCLIQDPSGGTVGLWQPGEFCGAGVFNEEGALVWNELVTKDLDAAKTFYGEFAGWGWQEMPMPDGSTYHVCMVGDRPNGGLMAMTDDWPEGVPSHWAVYFQVDDVDAFHAKAVELGATAHVPPTDIGVGRFSVVQDPQGAVFSLFKPNPAPDA